MERPERPAPGSTPLARARAWLALPAVRRANEVGLHAAGPLAVVAWGLLVSREPRGLTGDAPHLLGIALRLASMLRHGEWLDAVRGAWTLLAPHPPGAYLPGVLAYLAAPAGSRLGVLLAGGLGLWLCLDGVRRLGGGWVGALFLAGAGLLWAQAEQYGVDLFAAGCVAQALGHLVASRVLERRGHAAAWGAWMAAAFLVKYTAPFFLLGPSLLAGAWAFHHRRWPALGAAVAAFLAVAGPWYLGHLGAVVSYGLWSSDADNTLMAKRAAIFTEPLVSAARLGWYPWRAVAVWGWLGAAAVAAGAVWPARSAPRATRWVVLLALVAGWLLLTAQLNRQPRYLLPAIPLLAALAGTSRARWLFAPVAVWSAWCLALVYGGWGGPDYRCDRRNEGPRPMLAWPWPRGPTCPQEGRAPDPRLDDAIRRLGARHGGDAGTIGLLIPEGAPTATVGEVIWRSSVQSLRWSVASVLVHDPRGWQGGPVRAEVYVAPFATETWPSRHFETLLALLPDDPGVYGAWMAQEGYLPVEEWPFGDGWTGIIAQRRPGSQSP